MGCGGAITRGQHVPQNTRCRYQRPVGGVGEWPVGSHLGHMVPSESLVYPESTGDVDRDTQNGVLEAEIWSYLGSPRSPSCAW